MSLGREWGSPEEGRPAHGLSARARRPVLDAVLALAAPRPWQSCVDLSAGDGVVTFAMAPLVASVLTVEVSSRTATSAAERARAAGLRNVAVRVADLATFDLPPGSADLVVSSHSMRHLEAAEKRRLIARSLGWLRPGGRLVVADMMFGRGQARRDRRVVRQILAEQGVRWRVPGPRAVGLASPAFWREALRDAGFTEVGFEQVISEAGVIHGSRPRRGLTFTGPLTRS